MEILTAAAPPKPLFVPSLETACCLPAVTRWQSRIVLYPMLIFHGRSHAASTGDDGYY